MRRILSTLLLATAFALAASAADHPNILWITSEDHGPHMGCYGDSYATTPNVDALAARGMLFKHCWSNGPVCAAARTTIITGMYSPSTGGQHMRSMVAMPEGTKMYPQFLREAGYYCTNNSKEDYNLAKPDGVWDESSGKAHYKNRAAGQPFFAIFNSTLSHESQLRKRPHVAIHDPAKVRVPAYHPDVPEVRQDWAQYYDTVTAADAVGGKLLKELAETGAADDTIVFYFADHGSGMSRNKRWPCNSGLQVPMVVYFPPKWQHLAPKEYGTGVKSDRLVSFVDLAPTLLSLIGVKPPEWMQGFAFAGPFQSEPQPFVYGFRGRMDERYDCVRSATDGRYVYLRNYMPHLSQGQHVNYQFETPSTRVWRELYDAGKLNAAQSIFWSEPKAAEELYDLESDPDEVNNLASSPKQTAILEKMRQAQRDLALRVRDTGFMPEGELHAREPGTAPYDVAHSDEKYPLARIIETSELASSMKVDANEELINRLTDADSAVRWWAALGLVMRDSGAVSSGHQALTTALTDKSPDVRIAAAWALSKHGSDTDRAAALPVLLTQADYSKSGVFSSIAALNAIGNIGDLAQSIRDAVIALPQSGPAPDGRYAGYPSRLLLDFGAKADAPPKANKGKKKAKK